MSKNIFGRIAFLDYMRIFAFVSVMIGHKLFDILTNIATDPGNHVTIRLLAEAMIPLCWGGAAGVIIFFLTSGYIITHVLRSEGAGEFLVKRFFRIYPLYVFAVLAQTFVDHFVGGLPLPGILIVIPRLFLIGDFFGTLNSLGGVEWTLRVEVLFYILMAAFKAAGLMNRTKWLPYAFAVTTMVLFALPPFPYIKPLPYGYLTIYGPLLFIGSCIYLAELKLANRWCCALASLGIAISFLMLISKYQPSWKESNYGVFAIAIFACAWAARKSLIANRTVTLMSGMTYSIYLFHKWLWDYLIAAVTSVGIPFVPGRLQVIFIIFVICYFTHRTVEQYGIFLGRRTLAKLSLRKRNSTVEVGAA